MEKKLLKKGDIALIVGALFLCVILFLGVNVFNKKSGELVQIEVGGEIKAVLPLSENASFEVEQNGKITNTVQIQDGFAFVSYADCRDKICAEHKKISRVNESIICLPNKVVVTMISGDNSNSAELDGVV